MKELKRMGRNKWKMKKPTFEQFNMESNLRTVNLKVGQIFVNAKEFKEATKKHAIKQGDRYGSHTMKNLESKACVIAN